MRKRRLESRVQVERPEVKARVMAVLWGLSGEKTIAQICRETGLKLIQYYRLEGQLLRGMVMAAEASLEPGRRRSGLAESEGLAQRNQKLRQEVLRMQALLRLTRKLFQTGPRGAKTGLPQRGRRPVGRPPAAPPPSPKEKKAAAGMTDPATVIEGGTA